MKRAIVMFPRPCVADADHRKLARMILNGDEPPHARLLLIHALPARARTCFSWVSMRAINSRAENGFVR